MKKTSHRSVAAVVLSCDKSQLLLVKRRDVPVWVLPGGGVDPGELPEAAAVREVLEETGLHAAVTRHVATYTPINRLAKTTYVFECAPLMGDLQTGAETRDVAYFPLKALPDSFFFVHRDWLEDALKHAPAPIEKPLVQVTYFNLLRHFFRQPVNVVRAILARFGLPINS